MADVTEPRPGIAERLSQMIQLPTVSAELEERGPGPFEDFVALIADHYPLVHEKLTLERHTDFGLLFHWAGSGPASDGPVVLMRACLASLTMRLWTTSERWRLSARRASMVVLPSARRRW